MSRAGAAVFYTTGRTPMSDDTTPPSNPLAAALDAHTTWLAVVGGLIAAMTEAGFDVSGEADEVSGIAKRGAELLSNRTSGTNTEAHQ